MRHCIGVTVGALGLSIAGCMGASAPELDVGEIQQALVGEHLKGIKDADFAAVRASFSTIETAADGLGPIFNSNACGACHFSGAVGGASDLVEQRFGRFVGGVFDPLSNRGGSLQQLKTLGNWKTDCTVPLEMAPPEATIHAGRLTTPLFGLGLVDALPDSTFTALAAAQPVAQRGVVNFVSVLLPDPSDTSQTIGSTRVGRFGWKAGVPSLVQFAADAYLNEMGITTQHCFHGTSITAFSTESAPNGMAVPANCEDGIPGVDDKVADVCASGQTEIQDDVAAFAKFMTFLSPPGRDRDDSDLEAADADAPPGRRVFDRAKCAVCHIRAAFVTPNAPFNGVPGGKKFRPFSDFLLHDMDTLGDGIGNAGDSVAKTHQMRTAPLWGLRFRSNLLHDGRATSITDAITAHKGQGQAAADNFNGLSAADRQSLLQFLGTL